MTKQFEEITSAITESLTAFSSESGDLMQGFRAMSHAATKPGILDEKSKELIALAIGVAKQCDGCIGFHVKKLIKLGVKRQEFIETLNVAVYMGGGPALMYAADAISAFDQFSQEKK